MFPKGFSKRFYATFMIRYAYLKTDLFSKALAEKYHF
jgi:hypothetical protein